MLGEARWEARAKGELGFVAFLEGDSRPRRDNGWRQHYVGEGQRAMWVGRFAFVRCLATDFNEAKSYGEALAFLERSHPRTSSSIPMLGFRSWR